MPKSKKDTNIGLPKNSLVISANRQYRSRSCYTSWYRNGFFHIKFILHNPKKPKVLQQIKKPSWNLRCLILCLPLYSISKYLWQTITIPKLLTNVKKNPWAYLHATVILVQNVSYQY